MEHKVICEKGTTFRMYSVVLKGDVSRDEKDSDMVRLKKNHYTCLDRHAFYSDLTCVTVTQYYQPSDLTLDFSTRNLERTMNCGDSLLV